MGRAQRAVIALFACLVFWLAWQSRLSTHIPTPPTSEQHKQVAAPETSSKNPAEKLDWNNWTRDPIAVFTAALTGFNLLLVISTMALWLANLGAAKTARIAAEHIPRVERAYISGGGRIEANGTRFRFDMNNYGKTAGNIIEIRWAFCSADAVPSLPTYGKPHFYYDWIKPDAWIKGFHLTEVPTGVKNLAIYGRYYYRDVFNKSHSSGFILSIQADGDTTPIRAPAVYTQEQDETDPDENLSYQV